jgi:acyl-CoA synthetase (AMP-forming)/AMP-acid ligase II
VASTDIQQAELTCAQRIKALDQAAHWIERAELRRQWQALGPYTGLLLLALIEQRVAATPEVMLIFGSHERPGETTTGQALAESAHVAAGLHRLGLREGDTLVAQVPNWKEGMLTLLAALRLGLLYVPVAHTCAASELEFILRKTNARALVVPGRWKKIDYGARVRALGHLPDLEHVIVIGDHDIADAVQWSSLSNARSIDLPALTAKPDDGWLILFTSGTTGDPKGVVHTHHSFASEVELYPLQLSPRGGPFFVPMPSGHIAGLIFLLRPFLVGDPTILMDAYEKDLAIELLARYRADRGGGVPLMIADYMNHAGEVFADGAVQLTIGATSVPPSLLEQCEALGWPGTRSYGLTEHPTVSGAWPEDSLEKRAGTDGRLLAGVSIRLVGEDGNVVPEGDAGEIVTMGPELCKGYLDPEHNAAAFAADGWFHTGDIGVQDAQGYLSIVDRKKDLIIRGGENIASKEVEDVMLRHPAVEEVAALGWPDDRLGERVGIFVRLRAGVTDLTLAEVRSHFATTGLATYKTPEHIVLTDDFPRTPAGKIRKPELRARIRSLAADQPQ